MRWWPVLGAVVVTLAVAGCGSGATVTATKTVTTTRTFTVTGTVLTVPVPSGGGSGSTPTSAGRCTAAALAVAVRTPPGDAAAGSTYHEIEFTNTGTAACTLAGFPGVAARGAGRQLGSAAGRAGEPSRTVRLAPGETAHAQLQVVDVYNYPSNTCRRSKATDLRVYPPNDFTAHTVPFSFLACAKPGPAYLSVAPVRAGTGMPV